MFKCDYALKQRYLTPSFLLCKIFVSLVFFKRGGEWKWREILDFSLQPWQLNKKRYFWSHSYMQVCAFLDLTLMPLHILEMKEKGGGFSCLSEVAVFSTCPSFGIVVLLRNSKKQKPPKLKFESKLATAKPKHAEKKRRRKRLLR
nr:hypothetical protein [Tanacetum cinerariifolium]